MTFLWPQMLWLLLALPLLVALYLWLLRRRQALALRYASLSLVKEAMGKGPGLRRHVPPALFLLALAAMLLAASRPMAVVTLPSQQETIILAMDVSGSMRATDVKPNRLVASQAAAKAFLAELPRHVRVGIVSFAGTAQVFENSFKDQPLLIAAAILTIYIVLGILYESFIHPITILSGRPSTSSRCSAPPPSAVPS